MKKKSLIIIMCILFLTACSFKKDENKENPDDSNQVVESNNNSNTTNNSNDLSNTTQNSNGSSNNNSNSNNNAKPGETPYTLTAAEKEIVNKVITSFTPIYNNTKYTALSEKEKAKLVKSIVEQSYTLPKGQTKITNPAKVFTNKKLTNALHKYLGSNATMKFADVVCYVCGKPLYTYSKTKGAYVTGSHVNHTDQRQIILRHSQGVYKKGNNIRVKYVMMFSSYEEKNFPKAFYATYKNGKNEKNPVIKNSSKYCTVKSLKSYKCDTEKMAKENKFYTYVYNFEKKNNEFYFVGYEIEV